MVSRLLPKRGIDRRFTLVALVLLSSGGCDELLVEPPQGLVQLSVSYSVIVAAGSNAAVRVRGGISEEADARLR